MLLNEALKATEDVKGWLSEVEQTLLYDLARSVPPGGTIVELGSWMGRSTIMLAAGSLAGGRAEVHAVDLFANVGVTSAEYQPFLGGEDPNYLPRFEANIREAGVAPLIRAHQGETVAMAEAWSGPPIDLLFIDANHSFEGVRDDFLGWSRHCRPGARCAFHDYFNSTRISYGVRQFVDRLLAAGILADVDLAGSILHGTLSVVAPEEVAARLSRRWIGLPRLFFRPAREHLPRHQFAIYHGWTAFNRGDWPMAARQGLEAVRWRPWDRWSWWLLACSLARSPKKPAPAAPAEVPVNQGG